MLHALFEAGDWFAAKRYGYGAGLPIAWQGWLVLALYLLVVLGLSVIRPGDAIGHIGQMGGILAATALFVTVVARHTRGGFRWRWGED